MKSLFLSSLLALGLLANSRTGSRVSGKADHPDDRVQHDGGNDVSHRLSKNSPGRFRSAHRRDLQGGWRAGEIGWTWLIGTRRTDTPSAAWIAPYRAPAHAARPRQPGYKTNSSARFAASFDANVVMVPDGPYKTFKDLIEYARPIPARWWRQWASSPAIISSHAD